MEPDGLFPELPEDLSTLSDEELSALLEEHRIALDKVEADDPTYIGDMSAPQVLAEMENGVEQIKAIKTELSARAEAGENYVSRKAELAALAREGDESEDVVEELAVDEAEEVESEGDGDDDGDEGGDEEEVVEEPAVAAAAAATAVPAVAPQAVVPQEPRYRRVPQPRLERQAAEDDSQRTVLLAAAGVSGVRAGVQLDRVSFAEALIESVKRQARPKKHANGTEEKMLVASADYPFPSERTLRPNDPEGNTNKIRSIGSPFLGVDSQRALLASGGLCAPLTPLYDIPDFAVADRPVRDSLPSFRAERGGVSVPSVSTIGDITTAITTIEENNDALGGTFATKSCQDLSCPTWTDVAVGIISHCREYGNLNARAWPEGIAHENNLTLAAHSRTAEARLLDRIKSLSINVTGGATTLSAWSHVVYAITRTASSIRYNLRLGQDVQLRALAPAWLPDLLVTDEVSNAYDRWMGLGEVSAHLANYGVNVAWYLDTPSTGTSQGFSAETASSIDTFPTVAQIAVFVEGEFIHLDGGTLELGLVRDSTLNSTNDYQVFGETFENVARLGPTQGARWLSLTICPSGSFPALGTALCS